MQYENRMEACKMLLAMFTPEQQEDMASYVKGHGPVQSGEITLPDGSSMNIPMIYAPFNPETIRSSKSRIHIFLYFVTVMTKALAVPVDRSQASQLLKDIFNVDPGSGTMKKIIENCFTDDNMDGKMDFFNSAYFLLIQAFNMLPVPFKFDMSNKATNRDRLYEMEKFGEAVAELTHRGQLMNLTDQLFKMVKFTQSGDPEEADSVLSIKDLANKGYVAGAVTNPYSLVAKALPGTFGKGGLLDLAVMGGQYLASPKGQNMMGKMFSFFGGKKKRVRRRTPRPKLADDQNQVPLKHFMPGADQGVKLNPGQHARLAALHGYKVPPYYAAKAMPSRMAIDDRAAILQRKGLGQQPLSMDELKSDLNAGPVFASMENQEQNPEFYDELDGNVELTESGDIIIGMDSDES